MVVAADLQLDRTRGLSDLERDDRRNHHEKVSNKRHEIQRTDAQTGGEQHLEKRHQVKKYPIAVALFLQEFDRCQSEDHLSENARDRRVAASDRDDLKFPGQSKRRQSKHDQSRSHALGDLPSRTLEPPRGDQQSRKQHRADNAKRPRNPQRQKAAKYSSVRNKPEKSLELHLNANYLALYYIA